MKINIDFIYPVGSIYMSANATNPGILFGGTWTQLKDRFLLGAGNTYSAGDTGGEATHTLTYNEMPQHSHTLYNENASGWTLSKASLKTGTNKGYSGNIQIGDAGGNQAHNNMPPYLVVYMWKRTA